MPYADPTKRRIHHIWTAMKRRCESPKDQAYERYGGMGITVCKLWQKFEEFETWSLTHGYAPQLTIDRLNNYKGYSPSNCRWATRKEQGRNRKFHIRGTAYGQTKLIKEWAEDPRCVVNYATLLSRVNIGISLDVALSTQAGDRKLKPSTKYEAFGETKSLSDWSDDPRCNIPKQALRGRVEKKGLTMQEALSFPYQRRHALITAFGETKTASKWVKDSRCKVSYATLHSRVFRDGVTDMEKALTEPATPRGKDRVRKSLHC